MITFERLQNGLTRCHDRRSGLWGCYESRTGAYVFGDLRSVPAARIVVGA